MYRFRREDNELARQFFEMAVRLDPTFSRPYAGLSFTHFQNAFQGWGARESETELAYRFAAQGVLADDQDPAARWALGRAHWLRGRQAESLFELESAVDLSPNFSLGHYTLAFVQSQSGDAQAAIRSADLARDLSPFDPMLFAMLATRAMALMRLGRHDEAADWALKAIARPNAHVHILGIAAHCLALADRLDEGRQIASIIRRRVPAYCLQDFLAAFRFREDGVALIRRAAPKIGLG
jgi:tetratricopeptide (TPR) repeat protein